MYKDTSDGNQIFAWNWKCNRVIILNYYMFVHIFHIFHASSDFFSSRVYIGKRIATASTISYWIEDEAVPGYSPVSNHPPVVKLSLCIYYTPTFPFQSATNSVTYVDVVIALYTWRNVVALHHILTQGSIVHQLESSRWLILLELLNLKNMWQAFDFRRLQGWSFLYLLWFCVMRNLAFSQALHLCPW